MCTGNSGKFRAAQEHLAPRGIEVTQMPPDLDEIRATSAAEIAQHKARQAFEILRRPLFVEDSGFAIDEFNGWPGPMVEHALEAFAPEGIVHLADLTKHRVCRFASAAVYADGDGDLHTFADDTLTPGTVAAASHRGEGPRSWSDQWSIFIPEGSTTLAAMPPAEQERVFAQWRSTSEVAAVGAWLAARE
ncbi:non-canonical purine NTP pyrophosphatase [Streptomyces sp. NPDC050844]|uniref:non-canonical purine NTP pyrophosphatase n=1 Tax=Streptomyces sp. NPDC050844 TaxID=3155790 RepID=UPI0033EE7A19